MNQMHEQIIDLFNNPQDTMENGLWLSGYYGEGEYKEWWENGKLRKHCYIKDGEYDGEYKEWWENGKLRKHCYIKGNRLDGHSKFWLSDGKLFVHKLYKDGKVVKDFLE